MSADQWPSLALNLLISLTLALVLVFALRRFVRRWLGAGSAYGLWVLVPIALIATLLPNSQPSLELISLDASILPGAQTASGDVIQPAAAGPDWLLYAWLTGAIASLVLMLVQELRFRTSLGPLKPCSDGCWRAVRPLASPALIGLFRPRIVVPPDFEQRWNSRQRELVLAHERAHARRGDPWANGLAALLCAIFWFHPLCWLGLKRFRADQEIACDARVLREHPHWPRSYAEALLVPVAGSASTACRWSSQHTLKERITMLNRHSRLPHHRFLGLTAIGIVAACLAGLVWSAGSVEQAENAPRYFTIVSQVRVDEDDSLYEHHYQIAGRPGQAFGMDSEIGRHGELSQSFTFRELDDGLIDMSMTLSMAGETVATPRLIFPLDHEEPAAIATTDRQGVNFRLEIQASSQRPPM